MTADVFTEREYAGDSAPYLSPRGRSVVLNGMTMMAMPPGRIDVEIQTSNPAVNVSAAGASVVHLMRLNGERRALSTNSPNGAAFYGGNSELRLHCENAHWEILLEYAADSLDAVLPEEFAQLEYREIDLVGGTDPNATVLAEMAIGHLKGDVVDRLYLEGLGIALTARSLAFAATDAKAAAITGTDARIDRAIDYAHAHLTGGLSVAELAGIACMSPSWFSRAFKARTGRSVHAYVLDLRLDRARLALTTTREPIGNIAWACGFADHSHMTRLFKRRFGVPPSRARS